MAAFAIIFATERMHAATHEPTMGGALERDKA
jgi:hypothetical protein